MKKTKMLKKNYEFKKVLTKGKCFSGKYIMAFIQKNNSRKLNFLGLAISTKVCKAVGRNRLKRLIRESYLLEEPKIPEGYSIVFLWNKRERPENAYFKNIYDDVKKIFSKAELYSEKG